MVAQPGGRAVVATGVAHVHSLRRAAPDDERHVVLGAGPPHRGAPGRLGAPRPEPGVRPVVQLRPVLVRWSLAVRRPVRRALRTARLLLDLPVAGADPGLRAAARRAGDDADLAAGLPVRGDR